MRHCASFVCTAALVVGLTGVLVAEDWPQWRGKNRDGVSVETGFLQSWPEGGPPLIWKVDGIGNGFSSVAVAKGRIYTMGVVERQGVRLCPRRVDGQPDMGGAQRGTVPQQSRRRAARHTHGGR